MAFDSPTETQAVLCLLNPSSLVQGLNASGASQKELFSGSPGGFGSLVSARPVVRKAELQHAGVCRALQWGARGRRQGGGGRTCWGGSGIRVSLSRVLRSSASSRAHPAPLQLHRVLRLQVQPGKSAPPAACQHRPDRV